MANGGTFHKQLHTFEDPVVSQLTLPTFELRLHKVRTKLAKAGMMTLAKELVSGQITCKSARCGDMGLVAT